MNRWEAMGSRTCPTRTPVEGGDLEGGGRGGVPLGRVLGRGGGEVLLGRHDLGEDRAGEYAQTLRVGEREQAGFPAPRSSTGGPVGEDRSGP